MSTIRGCRLPWPALLLAAGMAIAAEGVMPQRLTLLPDQPQQIDGLRLTVVEIVEKRLSDGDSMMRVRVQAQAGGEQRLLEFTSSAPVVEWSGRRFHYQGGWRSEVQLEITPAAD